jgi:transposase-like protein
MTKEQVEVITAVQRRRHWSRAEKERIVATAMEPGTCSVTKPITSKEPRFLSLCKGRSQWHRRCARSWQIWSAYYHRLGDH